MGAGLDRQPVRAEAVTATASSLRGRTDTGSRAVRLLENVKLGEMKAELAAGFQAQPRPTLASKASLIVGLTNLLMSPPSTAISFTSLDEIAW